MKRLLIAMCLLLPPRQWIIGYWVVILALLATITIGLEPTGETTATLWNLPLINFGVTARQIQAQALIEMACHAWTLITLPMFCLFGLKPLLHSFRSDFRLFLRYSNSSRIFMESARLLSLSTLILIACAPLTVVMLWGYTTPGLTSTEVIGGMLSYIAPTLFIASLVYALGAIKVPYEMAVSIGIISPFLIEGVCTFLKKSGQIMFLNYMPPGLPYSIDTLSSPALKTALIFYSLMIGIRLMANVRTQWICRIEESMT